MEERGRGLRDGVGADLGVIIRDEIFFLLPIEPGVGRTARCDVSREERSGSESVLRLWPVTLHGK